MDQDISPLEINMIRELVVEKIMLSYIKSQENGDSLWTRKYIPLGWSQERTAGTKNVSSKVSDYNTIIMEASQEIGIRTMQ